MKESVMLTIASLLSIIFLTFHLADDIVLGMEKGGLSNLIAVPILVTWLYGTLVLAERRSGYVIMLIGSILAFGMPVIHVTGSRGLFAGQFTKYSGAFLFFWSFFVLGISGIFSFVLSAQALWGQRSGQPR